jgi:predicted transcriptional regulator
MLSRNDSDFIVGSNGHARLSQHKVGELLKVSQQAISKLIRANNLGFTESPEALAKYGFDGDNLAVLVEYYAFDSRQASKETVEQCRKIYRQAASKSFQNFIDALAGIDQQQQHIPYFYRRLKAFQEKTGRIPSGYFCIFLETIELISQLEVHGYEFPDHLIIDISIGKCWCNYMRNELEIEPDDVCMNYRLWYPGQPHPVTPRIYPLQLLPTFCSWFDICYSRQQMVGYLKKNAPEALPAVNGFLGLIAPGM